jgi:hypothetical protein
MAAPLKTKPSLGHSTNDETNSGGHHLLSERIPTKPYRIQSLRYSDMDQEDYLDKKDPAQDLSDNHAYIIDNFYE